MAGATTTGSLAGPRSGGSTGWGTLFVVGLRHGGGARCPRSSRPRDGDRPDRSCASAPGDRAVVGSPRGARPHTRRVFAPAACHGSCGGTEDGPDGCGRTDAFRELCSWGRVDPATDHPGHPADTGAPANTARGAGHVRHIARPRCGAGAGEDASTSVEAAQTAVWWTTVPPWPATARAPARWRGWRGCPTRRGPQGS